MRLSKAELEFVVFDVVVVVKLQVDMVAGVLASYAEEGWRGLRGGWNGLQIIGGLFLGRAR